MTGNPPVYNRQVMEPTVILCGAAAVFFLTSPPKNVYYGEPKTIAQEQETYLFTDNFIVGSPYKPALVLKKRNTRYEFFFDPAHSIRGHYELTDKKLILHASSEPYFPFSIYFDVVNDDVLAFDMKTSDDDIYWMIAAKDSLSYYPLQDGAEFTRACTDEDIRSLVEASGQDIKNLTLLTSPGAAAPYANMSAACTYGAVYADIDQDGTEEYCFLGDQSQNGFSFGLGAADNGRIEYYGVFRENRVAGNILSLVRDADGKLILHISDTEGNVLHSFRVGTWNGHFVLRDGSGTDLLPLKSFPSDR